MSESKIDETMISKIEAHIETGLSIKTACQLVGIGRATYYRWQARGARGEQDYADFFRRCERARAVTEARLNLHVERAAPNDWRAAAWKLEHSFPKDYAKHFTSEVEVRDKLEGMIEQLAPHMTGRAFFEMVVAIAIVNGYDIDPEQREVYDRLQAGEETEDDLKLLG